jgi:hypothetical protein
MGAIVEDTLTFFLAAAAVVGFVTGVLAGMKKLSESGSED